ncbi:class I SAM-dependent DNA methyltransferase [Gorillibacterium timonense]|uniref:class I SAM-dependent DNA methyltransferase n=1 Tax=Gorillibacterium timonense TaxID=1689269 RepID=UPI00071C78C6|nr:class I SAM-dependent methyltransferase [Gorillibacterium timonense]
MAYGHFASVYDRLMEDMPYSDWLAFVEECWRLYGIQPSQVVDLGCGTGTLSLPLAERGYPVTGIDLSADMLAMARRKAESKGLAGITWLEQDMREWELPGKVDAVLSLCDCLNYLTEEDGIAAAFRATWEGLAPGGLFIFDVNTEHRYRIYAEEQPFLLNEEDVAYLWYCDLEEETMTITHDLTIFAQEEKSDRFIRIEETHEQRAYPLDWLRLELLKAGFSRVDLYSDFTWNPVSQETERAFFVAFKGDPARV